MCSLTGDKIQQKKLMSVAPPVESGSSKKMPVAYLVETG